MDEYICLLFSSCLIVIELIRKVLDNILDNFWYIVGFNFFKN